MMHECSYTPYWQEHVTLPDKQACKGVFLNFTNLTSHAEVKSKHLTKFDPEITFWPLKMKYTFFKNIYRSLTPL